MTQLRQEQDHRACPRCGAPIRLRPSGTIDRHTDPACRITCMASGMTPTEIRYAIERERERLGLPAVNR